LSLDSHAAKCAEIFGVPLRIVERAQHVRFVSLPRVIIAIIQLSSSNLISTHQIGQLLDEGMTEKERLDLENAEAVCRRFLSWDLNADEDDINEGQVKIKLGGVLGKDLVVDSPQ